MKYESRKIFDFIQSATCRQVFMFFTAKLSLLKNNYLRHTIQISSVRNVFYRRNHQKCSIKKVFLKKKAFNKGIFLWILQNLYLQAPYCTTPCDYLWNNRILHAKKKKKPSTKVFSCEFCKIFIYKHLIAQLHVTTYETIEFCMQKKKKKKEAEDFRKIISMQT